MIVDLAPSTLDECEGIIERGMATFMEVGSALLRIRDERLYRNGYRDFETYCQARWAMSRPRAYQLMGAADIVDRLSTIVDTPLPATETQARELTGLDTETAAAVMTAAHAETNGKPTAKVIRETRSKFETPAPESDEVLTQEQCEAIDGERPDDVLTEAEWQELPDDQPEQDDEPEPEDYSPFIANVQKTFYAFALAEKRFSIDRISEVARADPQFATTLREDMTRARRWFKQIDAALTRATP